MNYAQIRQKGSVVVGGRTYTRQQPLKRRVVGQDTGIGFTIDKDVPGYYAVIDADDLQPSHLGGSQNPLHFIPEAQPRNRSASQSGALTPERIAQNLRPLEVIEGSTAYSGPPIVNTRGEVIQGNGRAYMMKVYYAQYPKDDRQYIKTLGKESSCLGFGPAVIREADTKRIEKPVLVRMVDATDKQAIELGQFTQADTEAVATSVTKIKSKVRLLTEPVLKRLITELTKGSDDDGTTLAELIRSSKVLNVLIKEEIIRVDDLENYTRNGVTNESGVEFVSSLLLNALFRGADVNTSDVFALLPVQVQNAVRKSTLYLLTCSGSKSLNKEVAESVLAYREFQTTGTGSLRAWQNQIDLQGETPSTRYAPAALALVSLYESAKTQKEIVQVFRKYSVLVNGRAGDMFSGPTKGKTKREALESVLNVKYRPDTGETKRLRSASGRLAAARSARSTSTAKKVSTAKSKPPTVATKRKPAKTVIENNKRFATAVANAKAIRENRGFTTKTVTVKEYKTPWAKALSEGFKLAAKGVKPTGVKRSVRTGKLKATKRKNVA